MGQHKVTLNVDGIIVTETVGADDGKKAITAAMKKHPVLVVSVVPLEVQEELWEPGEDQMMVDEAMEAVGEQFEREGLVDGDLPEAPDPIGDAAREQQERHDATLRQEEADTGGSDHPDLESLGPDGEEDEFAQRAAEEVPTPAPAEL